RAAGFQRDDPEETRLDKLDALLAQGTDQVAEAASLIAPLLSLPTFGRYPALMDTPQKQKEKTIEALVNQLIGLSKHQPVLCLFEDVHWIDPTTLEVLDQVFDRIESARVLLLVTFRPEFTPPWLGRRHVTFISLNRLGRRQSAA